MLDRNFAGRFTRLKRGVEEQVEAELHRALAECEIAERAYLDVVERRRSAQQARNHCPTAGEFQQWQGYIESLLWMEQVRRRQWSEAQAAVEQRKRSVLQAHQEVLRWETVESKAVLEFRQQQERMALKDADEQAVIRFGRGAKR